MAQQPPPLEAILRGDLRAIARAATFIENHPAGSAPLLEHLYTHARGAELIGLTGAPGSGKSTLTSALVHELRAQRRQVAVIAVDPSSPFTGGALLGDRIRMNSHYADPGVFIRSVATRGQVGGLAAAASGLAVLFDAAGFDTILIETVGVGQDEIDIVSLAALTIVILAPGQGDDVQAIKSGLMEAASLFVLNKSDLAGAAELESHLRAALDIAPNPPPIAKTVATTSEGVPALVALYRTLLSGQHNPARAASIWASRLRQMFAQRLIATLNPDDVAAAARLVAGGEANPYTIMEEWLGRSGLARKEP